MRTLAIGDIHGCLTALNTLLAMLKPTKEDRIVMLGDYVDRGPDSAGVIDRILQLRKQFEVINLKGNHEIMMVAARGDKSSFNDWMMYGGDETLLSYQVPFDRLTPAMLKKVPNAHWQFIENDCLPYFETDTHIFVHGTVWPSLPLEEQSDYSLYWEKFANNGPHMSGKQVVCGHTSQKSGWPYDVGHSICIDTWVYGEGWLTCLDVEQGTFVQANEAAECRTGVLA